jgi:hypothetical protein
MSIIKNVSGPYTINTIDHDDPIILDSNVVIVNGNLTVRGATTTITSSNTDIYDNTIRLNAGAVGAPILDAGIEVERGSSSDVAIRWNETVDAWQITNDGSLYQNVVSTTTGLTKLNEDPAPQISANLITGPHYIISNTSVKIDPAVNLQLDGNLALKMFAGAPDPLPNYNILHGGNVAAGGTGIYVTTSEQNIVGEELITKKRAVVYSIIF